MKWNWFLLAIMWIAIGGMPSAVGSDSRDYLYRRNRLRGEDCQANLRLIYRYLKNYAANHNGKLPAADNSRGLRELLVYGIELPAFQCEAAKSKKAKKIEEFNDDTTPYFYFGGVNLPQTEKICPKLLLLCDRPDSRHCNVLLADGTVLNLEKTNIKPLPERKISNCQDIVEFLNDIYHYPTDVLGTLRIKARRFDDLNKK